MQPHWNRKNQKKSLLFSFLEHSRHWVACGRRVNEERVLLFRMEHHPLLLSVERQLMLTITTQHGPPRSSSVILTPKSARSVRNMNYELLPLRITALATVVPSRILTQRPFHLNCNSGKQRTHTCRKTRAPYAPKLQQRNGHYYSRGTVAIQETHQVRDGGRRKTCFVCVCVCYDAHQRRRILTSP